MLSALGLLDLRNPKAGVARFKERVEEKATGNCIEIMRYHESIRLLCDIKGKWNKKLTSEKDVALIRDELWTIDRCGQGCRERVKHKN